MFIQVWYLLNNITYFWKYLPWKKMNFSLEEKNEGSLLYEYIVQGKLSRQNFLVFIAEYVVFILEIPSHSGWFYSIIGQPWCLLTSLKALPHSPPEYANCYLCGSFHNHCCYCMFWYVLIHGIFCVYGSCGFENQIG